jgi:Secretion system C-terminal sorting domain
MQRNLHILRTFTICFFLFSNHFSFAQNLVTYAGGIGKERFNDVVQLSNGTVLVAGMATDLDWVPASVPKTPLSILTISSASIGNIGFIMQLSSDLTKILHVVHFPQSSVRDIFKIRTTNVPGQPTGDIIVSGNRDVDDYNKDGYYLAKLNNNFVKGAPTGISWVHNVICKPRKASGFIGVSAFKELQPWDVGSDGKVIFGAGAEYDTEWAEIRRLNANGIPEVVENWHAHWANAGATEWDGTPAASYPNKATAPLAYSAIVLKAGRRGSMRSYTAAQYDATMDDGNGNTTRKGTFPDDYYYSGPCPFDVPASGTGGYTGYKPSDKPTQRLGAIVIDRTTNHFYYGYSTQSVLPSGLPDFEPAVVAMDNTGKLKWWNRLYKETAQNSTPDQYVDNLAIDYKNSQLVIVARCHGNNTDNFWNGNTIKATPTASGFQNTFTGTNGNIHISWLGKLMLDKGTVKHSTYVAEYIEGTTNYGAPLANPNMENWPDFNKGWANVNTTRINNVHVDVDGSVTITGQGRRTMTTKNAFQKMPNPKATAKGAWNYFVRTYTPDLNRPVYSSLLTGKWDTLTGAGGDNIELESAFKIDGGLLVVGFHKLDATTSLPSGAMLPTAGVPIWGNSAATNEQAVFARLTADSLKTGSSVVISDIKSIDNQGVVKAYPNPTSETMTVEFENVKATSLEVYDMLGRVQNTEGVKNGEVFVFKTRHLLNGVYYLRVLDEQRKTLTVLKFMKI